MFSYSAMDCLQDYYSSGNDSTHLFKALEFSDEAIACNKSNMVAYHIKFESLNLLGRYRKSLVVLDEIYELSGNSDIKTFAAKGLVYEKMGLADSARLIYGTALLQCDQRLKMKPADSVRWICDRFYVIAIEKGKDYALQRFDSRFANSIDPALSAFRDYLVEFNKEKVLFAR